MAKTLGEALTSVSQQNQPAGIVSATVESVQGDKVAVRIQRTASKSADSGGRRLSGLSAIGGTSRLKMGDTVYCMQISPSEYVVLSPKQQYAAGNPVAYDHTHADYLTWLDLGQVLGGYALTGHTHPQMGFGNMLAKPNPAIITYVDASGYAGTATCPGALYDHRHNLILDPTLQFSGASLGGNLAAISHPGMIPDIPNDATMFLSGALTWLAPPGGGGGAGHEHAIFRSSASPGQTLIDLPDFAAQIEEVTVGGIELDPVDWSLSDTNDQVVLSSGLAAAAIVVTHYVLEVIP